MVTKPHGLIEMKGNPLKCNSLFSLSISIAVPLLKKEDEFERNLFPPYPSSLTSKYPFPWQTLNERVARRHPEQIQEWPAPIYPQSWVLGRIVGYKRVYRGRQLIFSKKINNTNKLEDLKRTDKVMDFFKTSYQCGSVSNLTLLGH